MKDEYGIQDGLAMMLAVTEYEEGPDKTLLLGSAGVWMKIIMRGQSGHLTGPEALALILAISIPALGITSETETDEVVSEQMFPMAKDIFARVTEFNR